MKDFFVADAARFEAQTITSYFCLASISTRDGKSGKQYLALTLADKSGQLEARMWEDFADVVTHCGEGCYVKVQGLVSKYQGKFQITLTKMRSAAESEIDTADFIPTTQFDVSAMLSELRGYVQAFRNAHLRRLVFTFLDDPMIGPAFVVAPAAKRLHHAWVGGLLEHVLALVRVCLATAPFYPEVNADLLVTGAILHDIGKVRELSWKSTFNYTLEGQLIGHISIATGMLHEKIAELNRAAAAERAAAGDAALPSVVESLPLDFGASATDANSAAPLAVAKSAEDVAGREDFPDRLRLLLEHMLLSHHGRMEFGSPKLPMTPEAILLSALDDLEAKFQALRNEFAAAKAANKSPRETTDWVRSMERPLFNSKAFLEDEQG